MGLITRMITRPAVRTTVPSRPLPARPAPTVSQRPVTQPGRNVSFINRQAVPSVRAPRPAANAKQDRSDRPVMFGVDQVKRAIGDSNFFTLLPEFLPIKKKLEAMHMNFDAGCSSCVKRRAATSVTSDFMTILSGLSDDALGRVKSYLGVNRLLVRTVNRVTRKLETRTV